MGARGCIVLGVVLGVAASAPANPRVAGPYGRAVVVVVDTHTGMLGERLESAKLGTQLIARLLGRHEGLGIVSSSGAQEVSAWFPTFSPSEVGALLDTIAIGRNDMVDRGLRRAFLMLGHRGRQLARRVIVLTSTPAHARSSSRWARALHAVGIGVTYVSMDSTAQLISKHPSDRWYQVKDGQPLSQLLRADLGARPGSVTAAMLQRAQGLAALAALPPWWRAPWPCPAATTLHERRGDGGRTVACKTAAGVVHGRRTVWLANEVLLADAHYRNGALHGLRRRWHWKGVLQSAEQFRAGVRQGRQRIWATTGHLVSDTLYHRGLPHGVRKVWTASGALSTLRYAAGSATGLWELAESGGATRSEVYREGARHGAYVERTSTGLVIVRGRYQSGHKVGRWHYWRADGKTKSVEGRYGNGRREGTWNFYRADGQLRRQEIYQRGVLRRTQWF